MNLLVLGSGGREHALTWKIAQSPLADRIYCAPGNPGMAAVAPERIECVGMDLHDFDRLIAFAQEHRVALTVVGPEDPLARGIVDHFREAGLAIFGPSKAAAQLEASKTFAKHIMAKYAIPTAAYVEFTEADQALSYVRSRKAPVVVKADGLAAGKGVTVARDTDSALKAIEEAMVAKVFGDAGCKIIIEELLTGEEASILAFTDGKTILPMPSSQDHKPVFDGDKGPNTGGMGAYSPAPIVTPELFKEIEIRVLRPCVDGMAAEGVPYSGVLYAGLMITPEGPKVIEYNCRFGDPETQVVLPRMASDIVPVLMACCDGTLDKVDIEWTPDPCVSVVMASGGYPGSYEKGKVITGIDKAQRDAGVIVFHAGTGLDRGEVLTNGGRVLNVTATGPDIRSAIERAYAGTRLIHFDGAHYRGDIGHKALARA